MKRIIAIVLILSSLLLLSVTAYADDSVDNALATEPMEINTPATLAIDNQNT